MEETVQTEGTRVARPAWASAVKLTVLGVLVLLLLIPVASVLGLVREREGRADEVRQEIGGVWGRQQTLGAAVLTVTHRERREELTVIRSIRRRGRSRTAGPAAAGSAGSRRGRSRTAGPRTAGP